MSLKAKIEAVIYAAEEPVTLAQLAGLLGAEADAELHRQNTIQEQLVLDASPAQAEGEAVSPERDEDAESAADSADDDADAVARKRAERERARRVRELLRSLLDELIRDYATSDRGLEIREIAGGFRLATKPEYHDAVRGFARTLKPPLKLSLQALETLAVVAYKQPVTAPEVSEIRGVDSGGVLGSLMARKLVATAGRKQVIGRPILYKTTKDFLLRFGLKDLAELPSIEEFEKMATAFAQEEISMAAEGSTTDSVFPGGVESPGFTEPGSDVVGSRDGGGSVDSPPPQGGVTRPQADGDNGESVPPMDAPPLDGRISGLDPPNVEPGGTTSVDSPALDAAIQSGERAGSS